jgi:hypothetical protein
VAARKLFFLLDIVFHCLLHSISATKLVAEFHNQQGRIENNGSQEKGKEEETLITLLPRTRGRRESASPKFFAAASDRP